MPPLRVEVWDPSPGTKGSPETAKATPPREGKSPWPPDNYDPPRGTQRPRGVWGGGPQPQNPQPPPKAGRLSPPMGEGRAGGGEKHAKYNPEAGRSTRPNTGRCKHATLRGKAEGSRNARTLPLECPHGSPSDNPPRNTPGRAGGTKLKVAHCSSRFGECPPRLEPKCHTKSKSPYPHAPLTE